MPMFCGVVFAQQTKFLEQLYQFVHKFFHFTRLKPTFLFYTLIFTKYPCQSIYSTHLFNKIFTLLQFFIIFSLTIPF